MKELTELFKTAVTFPLHFARLVVSLLTVTLADPEMLTLVAGAVALGFATSPLIALAVGLLAFSILRTGAEVANRHTEQINFLARVIRDRDDSVKIRGPLPTLKLEADDKHPAQD